MAATILGLLGCVLPLLPIDLTGVRSYLPFPFGVAGLILGIVGCTGRRRGLALSIAGLMLSVLALVLGVVTTAGSR